MATSDSKTLSTKLTMQEPCDAELRYYLKSICSSPCPITMEAAIFYHAEVLKLTRIGRCLKVLNRKSDGQYESEDGVANMSRVQRRYLLRSMETGLRRSEANRAFFLNSVKEEVTPARGKADPYFEDLLFQYYTEKAEEAANDLLAKWSDPVVQALESAPSNEKIQEQSVKVPTVVLEESPKRPRPAIKHDSTRSEPAFSDDESGSEKAASGDEFGTDDDA